MTDNEKLSLHKQKLVRSYILKLVVLPGAVTTILSFVLGYVVKDYAFQRAFNDAYQNATGEAMKAISNTSKILATLTTESRQLLEDTTRIYEEVDSAEILKSTEAQIREISSHLRSTPEFLERLRTGQLRECQICFKETENSDQCQGQRSSCSDWSGPGSPPAWTAPFRDDTDRRRGGCTYQWSIQCR